MVQYKYDAYGNCITHNSSNTDLANSTPIRYRSYYYDADTGLYYLNARYYNPAWRRFISPDDTAYIDAESVNGLNLYAYCGNDPVNYSDPSGCFAISALFWAITISTAIGTVVGAGTSILSQYHDIEGDWSKFDWGKFAFDVTVGAISGGLAASPLSLGWSVVISSLLGATTSVVNDVFFSNEDKNTLEIILSAFHAAGMAAIAGVIAGAGANAAKDGHQLTKLLNSRNILKATRANGTIRYIPRQSHAYYVHANKLVMSAARYLISNVFSVFTSILITENF